VCVCVRARARVCDHVWGWGGEGRSQCVCGRMHSCIMYARMRYWCEYVRMYAMRTYVHKCVGVYVHICMGDGGAWWCAACCVLRAACI